MVKRRKVLIGAGSLLAGGAAATGTGAFSSAEAERGLTVELAGDSAGYLRFDTDLGNSPDNNYVYAEISDEELVIDFDTNGAGGEGVNYDSVMYFDDVFEINNQGTEPVSYWFELDGGLEDHLDVYYVGDRDDSLVGPTNATGLNGGVGDGIRIGIKIDTTGVATSNADLSGTITVHADMSPPSSS